MVARLVSRGSAAVTVEEAAVRTGISARTIDEWCRSGRLPSVQGRRPGRMLVCLDDLVAFLADPAGAADDVAARGPLDLANGGAAAQGGRRVRAHTGDRQWAGRGAAEETSYAGHALRTVVAIDALARQEAELRRRLESQRLLLEIAHQLASKALPGEVLEHVAASLKRVVQNDVLLVLRVDRAAGVLRPILGLYRDAGMRLESLPLDAGLTGQVVATGRPAIANDAVNDERTVGLPGYEDEGAESLMVLPLTFDGQVAGTLNITRLGEGRAFTEQELEIAELFAAQAAAALQNAERYERMERQHRELERYVVSQRRLLEASEKLLLARDPRDVLDTLGASLRSVVSYDSMQIHRVDEASGLQRPVFAADAYSHVVVEASIPLDSGLGGWAIAGGEAILSNDAHLDPRAALPDAPFPPQPYSAIAAPLYHAGRVCGVMCISRLGSAAEFSEREFELVKLFAAQASIALQNAEEYSAAAARAERDSLTGLRNHGALQNEIGELIGRRGPFALLMLDLDAFKAYNDAEGHPAGDALLREVAQALASATREADGVYRYGGDEFAVLLPGASRVAATEVVSRIRRAVASVPSAPARIGVSAGIACYPEDGRTRDDLVALADETLYHAKRAGHDRRDGRGEAGS